MAYASRPNARDRAYERRKIREQDAEIAAAIEEMKRDPDYNYDPNEIPTSSMSFRSGVWIWRVEKPANFLPSLTYVKSALHNRSVYPSLLYILSTNIAVISSNTRENMCQDCNLHS